MFKLQSEPTFWATVKISRPGSSRADSIEMEFRWLGREALRTYMLSLEGRSDDDALGEIIVNWRGVDADFTVENLARLLDMYPQSAMSIFKTFRDELVSAKEKN